MILLVNDDGIEAQGLAMLERAVREVFPAERLLVYAPPRSISGAGRSMTFGVDSEGKPKLVRVEKVEDDHFVVHGTPADCVEIACRLHRDVKLVLSGVNHGWNLGQDFYLSGTVQAALYALEYFGIQAVAMSAPKESVLNGSIEPHVLRSLERDVHDRRWEETPDLLSFNFPEGLRRELDTPESVGTHLGDYRAIGGLTPAREEGNSTFFDLLEPMNSMQISREFLDHWPTDVAVVMSGKISCTPWGGVPIQNFRPVTRGDL